jgi:GNAT superfamily N-acetyltransferase
MEIHYRRVDHRDFNELRIVAEAEARIPLEFYHRYVFAEASIAARPEFYKQLTEKDFFEIAVLDEAVVAFHILRRTPYPPDLFVGSVISLWVHPDHRGRDIARTLKLRGEAWARTKGLFFLQTHVHVDNQRMLDVNRTSGYEVAYLNLRKPL